MKNLLVAIALVIAPELAHADPLGKATFNDLLALLWRQIDPTDAGGQVADRGPQYRAPIFYHDNGQKRRAIVSKKALDARGFERFKRNGED